MEKNELLCKNLGTPFSDLSLNVPFLKNFFTFIFCLAASFLLAQNPSNLGVLNINPDNVTLSWTDNGCNTFLTVRYR